jgi:hypothetical protein
MSEESEIRNAISLVWRNITVWPSTFSPCSTDGCDKSARGGGRCLKCAERQLAELTTVSKAKAYVESCIRIRKLESELFGIFTD